MQTYLDALQSFLNAHPHWIEAAIFTTAFIESLAIAGIIVPGVAIMFVIGGIAGHAGTALWLALLWAALGAIAGDALSYWIGRRLQGRLHTLWPFTRYTQLLTQGETFFHRYGVWSVIIGRFIGPIRPVVPMVAGACAMPAPRFLACNVASAIAWAPTYVLPGYLVGAAMALNLQLPAHFTPTLIISLGVLITLAWVFVTLHIRLDSRGTWHQRLQTALTHYRDSQRIWRLMSSRRPGGLAEFPLASVFLFITASALFTLWSIIVVHTDWLRALDMGAAQFLQALRNPLTDPLMLGLTLLGDEKLLWQLFPVMVVVLLLRGHQAAALHIALAGLSVAALTHGFKAAFDLPRPELVMRPPASGSYPSGHASGITVLLGMLGAFMAAEWSGRQRWKIYLLIAVPMLLISLSRAYLGVHWLSDCIGGILLGLALCGLTRASFSRFDRVPISADLFTWLGVVVALSVAIRYLMANWQIAQQMYALATGSPAA